MRPSEWVAWLKSAVVKDQRAFDSIVESERNAAWMLQTRMNIQTGELDPPTRAQFGKYYGVVVEKLMIDRGITWEERLRLLIIEYSSMTQSQWEWVNEYAHRYRDTDHMLCKFIANAHRHWKVDLSLPEGGYYSDWS